MTEAELADLQARRGVDTFQDLIRANGFNPKEDVEHAAVCRYLDTLGILYMHAANEGKRSPRTGANLKRLGMRPGFPDLQIFDAPPLHPDAKGVCIEMKRTKGGKVSDEQRYWLAELGLRGWLAEVCEGANSAIGYLQSLGWKIGN